MVIVIGEVGKTCQECGTFFMGNKCPKCGFEILPRTPKPVMRRKKKRELKGVMR